ncbi:MAG: hypothetical protein MOIL_00722 [Candidatus Methanolliviera sp. GoM_oil]|nr:MAG: hypothetical protein MOIL_00722 [Candidatus Methanolliviera sp. GoM_oil]
MRATKRIPVTFVTWEEVSRLKRPGQTFDELLQEMVETEKKEMLVKEMEKIEKNEAFVKLE